MSINRKDRSITKRTPPLSGAVFTESEVLNKFDTAPIVDGVQIVKIEDPAEVEIFMEHNARATFGLSVEEVFRGVKEGSIPRTAVVVDLEFFRSLISPAFREQSSPAKKKPSARSRKRLPSV